MIEVNAQFDEGNGAHCICKISGNAELIAVEYSAITQGLMRQQGGQAILDRAMDIMKKEIDEYEEKGNK